MEVKILNIKGEDTGRTAVLNDAVFGIEPNEHVVYLAVKQYLANQRQGTHKSKERSEIRGSRRKIGRQKGGGGARRGDLKSPVLVGGGRVFGPVPRSYAFKLNKKVKELARHSVLSYKAQNEGLIVLEDFSMETPKTKNFLEILNNIKIQDKKSLFVLQSAEKSVHLSARNLKSVKVTPVATLNTYAVLNANVLVLTESALKAFDSMEEQNKEKKEA